MKRISLICLAFAMPLAVMADTTVFSDNFKTDGSDPSASYLKGTNSTSQSWANNVGISLGAATTGKNGDVMGSFSAVTLSSPGQYISMTVNFNSPNFYYGTASSAGSITFGLDNSLGTGLLSMGASESVAKSSAPGYANGATVNDLGYMGNIPFETTGKASEKLYGKTGGGGNSLTYYSNAGNITPQFDLVPSIGNGSKGLLHNLANNDSCTLTFTLTYLAAGQTQLAATLYDNTKSEMEFTLITGATNSGTWYDPNPTEKYDTFAFGLYAGNEAPYTLNFTSALVVTNVPEPESVVLFLLGGVGALGFVRRFRR
jgi:hypothetical protein